MRSWHEYVCWVRWLCGKSSSCRESFCLVAPLRCLVAKMTAEGAQSIPGLSFPNAAPLGARAGMGGGGPSLGGRDIVAELTAEKDTLDPSYVHSIRLLTDGE